MDKFVAILCIVNDGFSTEVMDVAKKCGARGGTVMHARGTAAKEAEKIFNISIQPEKEIVMILAQIDLVDSILKGLYNAIGSKTQAQGIVFALPVDEVVGIENENKKKVEE
jgi:nitrogen regulatory protein PII